MVYEFNFTPTNKVHLKPKPGASEWGTRARVVRTWRPGLDVHFKPQPGASEWGTRARVVMTSRLGLDVTWCPGRLADWL